MSLLSLKTRDRYRQHQLSTIWNDTLAAQYKEELTAIARAAHTANLLFSEFHPMDVSVADGRTWDEHSEQERQESVDYISYLIKNPLLDGREAHDAWMVKKQEAGWKFGRVKNNEKKEHPCMVPYNQLNAYDMFKDDLYVAVITPLIYQFAEKVLTIYKAELNN